MVVVVWRLSGTGSQEAGETELARDTGKGLQALIDVALEINNLKQFLGRERPTVITQNKGVGWKNNTRQHE